jgi:outer membrane autotransporter protein
MAIACPAKFLRRFIFGSALLATLAWAAPAPALNPIILPPGSSVTQTLSATQENQELIDRGSATPQTLPFLTGTTVYEIRTSRVGYYVRYYKYDPSNKFRQGGAGRWMMAATSVKGLNTSQVRDLYALPDHPNRVIVVHMPAGTLSRTGTSGPIAGWGDGGGQQFLLNDFIPSGNYNADRTTTDDVYRGSFAAQAGGGNPGAVAAYLDGVTPGDYTLHAVGNLMLSYLPTAPRRQALNQLGPERYDTLSRLEFRQSILFSGALSQRRSDLRTSLMGSAGEKVRAVGQPAPFQQKVGGMYLWGRGAGGIGDAKSTGENTGFDYRTGSFLGGADWLVCPNFIFGLGTGFITSQFDWKDSGGNGTVGGLKLGAYGSYFSGRFFLDGTLAAGYNANQASRRVFFPGMDYYASAKPSGYSFSAGIDGGLNFLLGGWTLQPLASLNLMYVTTNAFTEENIDSLSLRVNDFDATALRSELALRLAKSFACESGLKFVPEFRLGWAHDFVLGGRDITAGLVDQASSFTVTGYDQDSDAILPGLGLTLVYAGGSQAYFRYDAEIGGALAAHILSAGVRIPF